MKDGQEEDLLPVADSLKGALNSPHLEIFKKKSYRSWFNVNDRIDEWMMGHLNEYGKQFQDISRGQLDLGILKTRRKKRM